MVVGAPALALRARRLATITQAHDSKWLSVELMDYFPVLILVHSRLISRCVFGS